MDKMGADFYMSLNSIHDRLSTDAFAIQLPIGQESSFSGVVDIIRNKAFKFEGEHGITVVEIDIPADMVDKVKEHRDKLVEKVAEASDELTSAYLENGELTEDQINEGIRVLVLSDDIYPVMCGSALQDVGVQPMLDAVVKYLPSPLNVPLLEGTDPEDEEKKLLIKPDDSEPFVALAFKIATDPFVGKLAFFRVYSGILTSGSYVVNTTTGQKERIGRIVRLHANHREDVDEVYAGDIAAAIGLKKTTTGDTLCAESRPVVLEKIIFPEPVISVAIEPNSKQDAEKMSLALQKLAEEDPTFRVHTDDETLQTIIEGMGELHLDIIVDRMRREFKVEAKVGAPQVAYKETIKMSAEAEGKYIKQSGGRGQYGHCWIKVEPREQGEGFEFVDEIKGGIIPKEYIPAIEKGVKEAMDRGIVAGYPLVDIKASCYDGSFHEVDSSEIAFKMAGSMAFQAATKKANPVLLEPIMKVEVLMPEDYMGDVVGDLSSKRGQIQEMTDRGQAKVVKAMVPLSEMFGYATNLRSMTQGRATYSMEFEKYSECPKSVEQAIVEGKK
jgi:elongation factor G